MVIDLKKLVKIVVVFAFITLMVVNLVLPSFAVSSMYVGGSYFDGNTGLSVPGVVNASSSFSFYFGGLTSSGVSTVYSSGVAAFPGYICRDPDESAYYFEPFISDTGVTSQNQQRIYNSYEELLFRLVNNVSSDSYLLVNGNRSVEYVIQEGSQVVPHQVAFMRYISHAFQVSSYKPNQVILSGERVFCIGSDSYYDGGYGGLILPYLHDGEYPSDDISYTFTATLTTNEGSQSKLLRTGTVSKDANNTLHAALVPSEIFNDLPVYAMLTDINITYDLSYLTNIPASNNAWTFYTVYEIAASDNGALNSGATDFYFDNYDFVFDLYLSERSFGLGGDYLAGYEDGKADGYDDGYLQGEIAGKIEGYDDGFEDGKTAGYDDGYQLGSSEGYQAGQLNPTQAVRDEIYNTGYQAGQGNPTQSLRDQIYNTGYQAGQLDPIQDIRDDIYDHGFRDGVVAGESQALMNMDFTTWLGHSVSGFMDFQIFSNITIGGILAVCIGMALVMMFLKFFAGG